MIRLFVGLALPEDIVDRLGDLAEGLSGARWIAPENLHMTLRFIGSVDNREASDIDEALSRVSVPAFSLHLKGLGFFGKASKPHNLWIGAEPEPTLTRLQAKVERALQMSGCEAEGRKFKPHITLARFKNGVPKRFQEYLSRHALADLPPFTVSEFLLYSSFLTPAGSLYQVEARYPLEDLARQDSDLADLSPRSLGEMT
jgi:2'-5' RNA ligase